MLTAEFMVPMVPVGEADPPRERRRSLHVATTTEDLLENLRAGMTARLFRVSDGLHTEDFAIPVWTAGKLIFHLEDASIPQNERERGAVLAIHRDSQSLVGTAKQLVMTEKMIELWLRDDVPGGKHHILPLGLKAAALRLQLALTDLRIKEAEGKIDPLNRVPFSVAADLQFEIDTAQADGSITRDWVEDRLRQLLNEAAPRPRPRAKTRRSPPTSPSRASATFPFGLNSAGLPDTVSTVDAATADSQVQLSLGKKVALGLTFGISAASLVACEAVQTPTPQMPIPPGAFEVPLTPPQKQPTPEASQGQSTPIQEPAATATEWAAGGPVTSCEAAADLLFIGKPLSPDGGYLIPPGVMVKYSSNPDTWTLAEQDALVDADGSSIAPSVNQAIAAYRAIDPSVRATNLWAGEGYVLELRNAKGNLVWAIGSNGLPQYRPDIAAGTSEFREIPPSPVRGDIRYMVASGCGVLGVFDGDVLKAIFSPQVWEWQQFLPPETATPEVVTADDIVEMLHGMTNDQLDNKAEVHIPTKDSQTITLSYDALMSVNGPVETYQFSESARQNMLLYTLGRLAFFRYRDGAEGYEEMQGLTTESLNDAFNLINAARERLSNGKLFTTDIVGRVRTDQFNYDKGVVGDLPQDAAITGIRTAYITREEFRSLEKNLINIPHLRINRYLSTNIPSPDPIKGNVDPTAEEMLIFLSSNGELIIVYHNEIIGAFASSGWWDGKSILHDPDLTIEGLGRTYTFQMFKPLEAYSDPATVYNWTHVRDFMPEVDISFKK